MHFYRYTMLLAMFFTLPTSSHDYNVSTFQLEPWAFFSQDHKVSGIIPDIVNAIATEADVSVIIDIIPYTRMVKYLQIGTTDFTIFTRNSNNDKFVNYVDRVFVLNVILLTRKGMRITSLENLYEQHNIRSIGVLRGTNIAPNFPKNIEVTQHLVKDFTQGLKMLHAKRIDAFLTIDRGALYESKKLGIADVFEFPGYPVTKIEAWLQVSKKSKYENSFPYQVMRNAIKKLTDKGTIEQILQKHLEGSFQQNRHDK